MPTDNKIANICYWSAIILLMVPITLNAVVTIQNVNQQQQITRTN